MTVQSIRKIYDDLALARVFAPGSVCSDTQYKGPIVTLKAQACLPLVAALILSGCGGKSQAPAGGGAAGAAPPPPSVQVAKVQKESVSVFNEYSAALKAVQTVEIRTRVSGTLESVHFAEGAMVSAGQVLFQLDPAPFYKDIAAAEATLAKAQAGVSQAEGNVSQARAALGQAQARLQKALTQVNLQASQADLARAKANLDAAEREVQRYAPLKAQGAVPGQQYDRAVDARDVAKAEYDAVRAQVQNTRVDDQADVGVARADVAAAQANVESAQAAVEAAHADVQAARNAVDSANLQLSYTTIKAPFTGFISRVRLDQGTMIVQGNAVLANLSSANPIYAEFSISEPEYLALKEGAGFSTAPLALTLSNGQAYPHEGQFVMTENQLDTATGTLLLRAQFENPDYLLKPGGFARVKMKEHELDEALVIPQKAIFSNQSLSSVYVLKSDNTVDPRTIKLGDRVADKVVVTEGLKEGESIVVDGLQKVRPGATVVPETEKPKAS